MIITFLIAQAILAGAPDPLPSWNEGPTKSAIVQFVKDVTDQKGKDYVQPQDRIAVFDQDGTLWVEQPLYTQLTFAIDHFKGPLPTEGKHGYSKEDLGLIVSETQTGTLEEYHTLVKNWLVKALHPRFKKHYTSLVYQPMLEAIQFFKDNGFMVYIVSGGGQEFMRVYTEKVYGIPPEKVIGSAGKVKYEYRNGQPILMKIPEILLIDDKQGKPETINLIIGKKPIAAFGNSDGDREMLEWTQSSQGKTLALLVHHDDAEREYAYDEHSPVGTFSATLMQEAKDQGWLIISMKNDWKVIFPSN